MKKQFLIGSILSLILGTLVYLLFRVSTLKIFSWLENIGVDFLNFKIRKTTLNYTEILPDWFLFSLPDGLWIFSYTSLILHIWGKTSKESFFWIIIIPAIAIFSEILQGLKLIPGTFDSIDLLFYTLGLLLPLTFINKNFKLNY